MYAAWSLAVVPGLIDKGNNEYKLKTTDGCAHPIDSMPICSPLDDKVGETWSDVWRRDIDDSPQSNLTCSLVEEEKILDECDRDGLSRGDEEACQSTHGKEGWKVRRHCRTNTEDETANGGPEKGGCTSEERSHGDP